ncbi:MAG: alkaline phosphatase D family protein [Gemmatimonadetes bacterium]|nr:alkaline phosphatase D family protein [Gemmatimonadota bacterium]
MNRVIGPFLGARGPGRIRIVIGLPDSQFDSLTCEVLDSRGLPCGPPLESRPTSGVFKSFVFDVEDLAENENYTYVIKDDNGPVDLGSGLGEADCHFRGPAEFGEEDYFILLSCNDPFAADGKSTGAPWAMWDRLEEDTRGDENCRLLLLGGDQVYCDELERQREGKGFIKKLEKSGDATSVEVKLRDAFIQQYHKYWNHDSLRKVFARIPSLAMWDDHDITDGWGSRLESFDGTETKPSWRRYFNIAREAFEAYQAVRNPAPFTGSGYTSFLDVGRLRFYMMDFRSERNATKAQLWSEDSHNDFMKNLAEVPRDTEKVFVLSPVVALRCNFEGDRRLSRVSEMLFSFRRWMKERPWTGVLRCLAMADIAVLVTALLALVLLPSLLSFAEDSLIAAMRVTSVFVTVTGALAIPSIVCLLAMLLPRIPELPDIADDLNDSLTSEKNRNTFTKILKQLFALCDQGKYVAILAGDIHVGGLSEFIRTKPGSTTSIPQIVSSPIASVPMPKAVEGLTTTTSEMRMWCEKKENCYGKNLFYQSKRNYVKIYPHRSGSASGKPLLYYFEGHTEPTALHDSMRPAD